MEIEHQHMLVRLQPQQVEVRPYICRFTSLSLFTWPSVWPLLQGSRSPAATAA